MTDHNPKLGFLLVLKKFSRPMMIMPPPNIWRFNSPQDICDLSWFTLAATFSSFCLPLSIVLPYFHFEVLFYLSSYFRLSPKLSKVKVFILLIHGTQYRIISLNNFSFHIKIHTSHTFWGLYVVTGLRLRWDNFWNSRVKFRVNTISIFAKLILMD